MTELSTGDEGRMVMGVLAGTAEVGRAILTTPGVPAERLAALRAAFQAMLKDPQFIAATVKRHLMIAPARGEEIDAISQETMALPKPVVEALRKVMRE
jgi:tripartite-type tricarboxylate transporter receptor subunit TctC